MWNAIYEAIVNINGAINDFVWGVPCLVLLIGTGLYYTIRLGFMQFRHPGFLFRETVVKAFKKKDDAERAPGELTSFQAAMTSVGAIVGSGNIAGVATAIVIGGPGAVLWMLIAALIGMSTKFAEVTLGVKYREINKDGSIGGGAMYYLAKGLKAKWLGVAFSFLVIPYAFVISAVVDTNSIALTMQDRYAVPTWSTGLVLAALTAVVVFGGVQRIGKASAVIAPFMGGAYVLAGVAVILLLSPAVPSALCLWQCATALPAASSPTRQVPVPLPWFTAAPRSSILLSRACGALWKCSWTPFWCAWSVR